MWKYIHNRIIDYQKFYQMPEDEEGLRYEQHDLGRGLLSEGNNIPDEWFGEHSIGITIGRTLWGTDERHDLIMHPYVRGDEDRIVVDIRYLRRLDKATGYEDYVKEYVNAIFAVAPDIQGLIFAIYFRDTLDELASLNWARSNSFFIYSDEHQQGTSNIIERDIFDWLEEH